MTKTDSPVGDRPAAALLDIFLLALCVRLVYAVFFTGLQTVPPGDATDYVAYAENLLSGHGYTAWGYQAFRPPGYPFFIAGVFGLFGRSYPALKLAQVFISSLIPVMVYLIGLRLFRRGAALLAAVYACFYFGLFSEPSTIMSEAVFTFLLTLTALLTLSAGGSPTYAAAAGASLGAAILTRPVGLLAVPFFAGWLFLTADRARSLRAAAIAAAVCVLVMAPWWARNYRVFNAFVPVCLETGGVMENVNIPVQERSPERYQGISEYQKDRLKTADAFAYVKRQGPAAFLKRALPRMATFFYPFLPAYDLTWAFMLPFWLAGMYAVLKERNKPASILFTFAIVLPIYFLFCATTRYKYSVSQFIILFAAAGFFYLREKYRGARFNAALCGWALANLAVWFNAPFFRALALKLKGS